MQNKENCVPLSSLSKRDFEKLIYPQNKFSYENFSKLLTRFRKNNNK